MKLLGAGMLAAVCVAVVAVPVDAASSAATWAMNEKTGSIMTDASGNANNGTLQNVRLGVAGSAGTGYGFNGRSARVVVPDSPSLNPGLSDLTITIHVAMTTLPADDYDLIRKGYATTTGGDYKIEIVNVGGVAEARCYFRGSTGSYQKTIPVPNLLDGLYHTIVCQKKATSAVMTVDGHSYSRAATIGSIANTAQLILGAKSASTTSNDWFAGSLDEVSIAIG